MRMKNRRDSRIGFSGITASVTQPIGLRRDQTKCYAMILANAFDSDKKIYNKTHKMNFSGALHDPKPAENVDTQ